MVFLFNRKKLQKNLDNNIKKVVSYLLEVNNVDKSKKVSRLVMSSIILAFLVFGAIWTFFKGVPDGISSVLFSSKTDIIFKFGTIPFVVMVVLFVIGVVKMVKVVIAYATSKGDLIKMNEQIKSSAGKFVANTIISIPATFLIAIMYQVGYVHGQPSEDYIIELSKAGYACTGIFLVLMIVSLILSSILRKGNKKEYDETHVVVEQPVQQG